MTRSGDFNLLPSVAFHKLTTAVNGTLSSGIAPQHCIVVSTTQVTAVRSMKMRCDR